MAQLEQQDPIYRTSPERTVKMMVIMLGICIAGGGIFFGMWDYWISMPPAAGNLEAGTGDHGGAASGPVTSTGVEIPVSLSCLLYTSPSPRDATLSRMPSSA